MIDWLQLNNGQRKAVIDEAEQLSGISAKAIEKDWWVTLILKALFQSAYSHQMAFKGGTSLSKGWKLIARFSEDIDIALDPQAFGMVYKEDPTKGYVDKLKREGCNFTSTLLLQELQKQLQDLGVPDNLLTIEAAPVPQDRPDTDPQTLFVKYPSLYEPNDYIADEVKVEVSVRSLRFPTTTVSLQSILHEVNPKPAYTEIPFPVEVVEPRKTFLEKIFLLHEEFGKPDKTKIRTHRMSRHLYDLFQMAKTPIGATALADHGLYSYLIKHREWYSRISWVDYSSLGHETVSIIPTLEVMDNYNKDYQTMQEQMIHEDSVSFDQLILELKLLQGRLRLKHEHRTLDDIIEAAQQQILNDGFSANKINGSYFETVVVYKADPAQPTAPDNKNIVFKVGFLYQNDELVFDNIAIVETDS
jgi:Nucleotidyl transferase AbiEii toxin, Type IV TA system